MQTVTVCPDVKYVQRPSAERTICMHMLTNAMKKIWSCTNVIPARKQYLKLHMDIHTGAPRKQCKYCDKDFSDKSHLHRHMKKCHPTPKSNILLRPIPITIMWSMWRHSHIGCICFAFLHNVLSNAQVIWSTGSQSHPRISQLPFWPAGFLTSLVAIENITDIFFPI